MLDATGENVPYAGECEEIVDWTYEEVESFIFKRRIKQRSDETQ